MLSYQHGYHAGGPADIHKHAALARMLDHMARARRSCTYVETHAGRGLYDLASPEARKTGEAARGIIPALKNPADLPEPYLRAIRLTRALHGPDAYPGSPLIAQLLLRPSDPLHLMELHPQEYAALKKNVHGPGIHVARQDGLVGAMRLLPPHKGDGFLFVDPSYEVKTDYAAAAAFVLEIYRKWQDLRLLLWYPILDAGYHELLVTRLMNAGLPGYDCDQFYFKVETSPRLRGSGLIGINLPDQLKLSH